MDAGTNRSQAPFVGKVPGEIATVRIAPFDRKAPRQSKHACLCHGTRHHIRRAGPSIGGDDAEDDAAMALFNPTFASSERAIGGAMEHDVEDGIHRAMGKSFGASNEITGSIVD